MEDMHDLDKSSRDESWRPKLDWSGLEGPWAGWRTDSEDRQLFAGVLLHKGVRELGFIGQESCLCTERE